MVTGVLGQKLRRDLWQQRWRFGAIAVVVAIGVAVFVAATDGYRNLEQSFSHAYAAQRLPDAVVSGPGAARLADAVAALPGQPVTQPRHQADIGIRIHGHTLFGRVVGEPDSAQPAVSLLDVQSGTLPHGAQVTVEQHLADHYGLRPGDTVEVRGPDGWQSRTVAGSALSTEYLWPARSSQEILTTPEQFGVVFATDDEVGRMTSAPTEQLAVYARDRAQADELVSATAALAHQAGLTSLSREDIGSYHTLRDDVAQFGTLAKVLPWLFLAAVVLGIYVLLSRIVSAQRAVIGTLIANGLSPSAVRGHYVGYGVASALLGIVPGLIGGYLLGGWITTKYTDAIALPLHVASAHPITYLLAAMATFAAALVAALAPAVAAARMQPVEALRIAPPAYRGGRSIIERLLPPLRYLPARWRMTLRAVFRSPRRTVFTAVGVGVAVVLVMVFAGMRDTLPGMVDRQFGQIARQDGSVVVAGSADTVAQRLRDDPDVAEAETYSLNDVTLATGLHRYQTLMIGLRPQTDMHSFRAASGSDRLGDDGVLLGVGLRDLLSVSLGDTVDISPPGAAHPITQQVVGFVDEPFSPVVYVSLDHLRALTGTTPNGVLVKLHGQVADERAVGDRLATVPGVVAYLSTRSLADSMRAAFSLYNTLVGIMLVFAAIMAAAMLFNAMSANVSERLTELSALRAEGMDAGMLARLISAENLAVAVVAIPFGVGFGVLLADRLLSTYQTLGYHLRLELRPGTAVVVAVAMLVAAAVIQLPSLRRIYDIDVARVVRERAL
ncbi:FtsX-like permease family protein [Nocardia sp. NPDC051321]|uniref:ABC transporter permease n=1 Tax=Nocardia sp. NPDC051321 TaxID=3364323 RepID=UPI0037A37E2D